MIRILIILLSMVIITASCCPLYTDFHVAGKPAVKDHKGQLSLNLSAVDAHYTGGNMFTVYVSMVNTSKDTLYVRQRPPFKLRTHNFDLSARYGSVTYPQMEKQGEGEIIAVNPSDSLKTYYSFNNDFRGGYKSFRKMLKNAQIFVQPQSIILNGEELQFDEEELVVREKTK